MTEYRRWVEPQLKSRWDTVTALGVALMPGVLANLIGLVFCSLHYRDSNIHLLDMKLSRFYFANLVRKPT